MKLYTGTGCVKCKQLKKLMDDAGLTYSEVSIDDDPIARAELLAQGYMALPVIKTETGWLTGEVRQIFDAVQVLS